VNAKDEKYTQKSCKILNLPTDPTKDEGEIVFVVPKLPAGVYDVIVTNSVGSNKVVGGFITE
jgi:hypothetical protein